MVARVVGILALAAATLASPQSASAAVLCYVKWNAAGLNNGGSWTNAFTNLQSALGSLCSDVWVAAGVYKPDGASPGDQTLSFTIMAIGGGKRVYGGFAGAETLLSQRDPAANLTILSGDIDNNDTNVDGNHIDESHTQIVGNNSYHVVTFDSATGNVLSTTTLDGFIITGGAADGVGGYNGAGGGIICYAFNPGNICSPSLYSLTISGNYALNGGGIYDLGYLSGTSSPTLIGVTFQGNRARDNGGAMLNSGLSSPHLTGVTFDTNTAQSGGAVFNQGNGTGQDASPVFVDAYFTNNTATDPTASWGSGARSTIAATTMAQAARASHRRPSITIPRSRAAGRSTTMVRFPESAAQASQTWCSTATTAATTVARSRTTAAVVPAIQAF